MWKTQTLWTRFPARIEGHRGEDTIGLLVVGEHEPGKSPDRASIFLTANEATAIAAWIADQAEQLMSQAARAAARAEARRAARAARSKKE
jgi:hypothetical protein